MKELDKCELQEVEGGFLWLLIGVAIPYALFTVVDGVLAMGVLSSYDSGYRSVINQK
jgi:lactobin A/cerein 7B family class IIb bacteriocin